MVQKINCECADRFEIDINSNLLFEEIKLFFDEQVDQHVYKDIPVKTPFYIGLSRIQNIKWYATKWYKCKKMWMFMGI